MPAATAVAAHLQTRRQRSAGDGRIDRRELLLGEGHASLGRGHRVHDHLRERGEPVVDHDDPEEVIEGLVAFGRCIIGYEIICIYHTLNSYYKIFHSMKNII